MGDVPSSLFGGSGAGGDGPSIISETIVYAPTDGPCPPQTPLLGSSKMVANVRSTEMKRQISRITWAGAVSSGDEDIEQHDDQSSSVGGTVSLVDAEVYLEKVRSTFYQDAITFAEGTIPQSIAMAIVIGIVCGVVAYLYYLVLFFLLDVIWKDLPNAIIKSPWPEGLYVLYIPLVTLSLSLCSGLSVYFLGEPGDLAFTIKCVHEKAYEGTSHILPMVCASLFTILAGASLGPEAPLVGICAATAGFVSRKIFQQQNRNVVRKHTLMGMAGALASFFGVPLGGSLFALEVTSRFSVEYFEHLIESIACGEVCVAVFRSLAQLPLGKIWDITPTRLGSSDPILILIGAAIGLLGAGVATLFASFHWRLMSCFNRLGLLDDENRYAVPRVLLAAIAISVIGMLVPHTYFWGEFEFNTVATTAASDLRHIWPTSGLIGFEMDSWAKCIVVGVCKIIAISFTVAGGYRGGFIFPFFVAGAAFGRALVFAFPTLNPAVSCLCFAAGINVAITRTALATSLILSFLSDEMYCLPAILAASISSLFTTAYLPFIKTQIVRSDIDHSLFYKKDSEPKIQDTIRTLDGLLVVPTD